MKSRKIKKIFKKIYKYPNPIFCIPIYYFQHKSFICEVARTKNIHATKWNNWEYKAMSPLLIFEGLFITDGCWITVLERKNNNFEERLDLNQYVRTSKEVNKFINQKLN